MTSLNSEKSKTPFHTGGYDMPVVIHKNPNGDTRTAPKGITFDRFREANDSHMADVAAVMNELGTMLCEIGERHDWTKRLKKDVLQ